MDRKKMDPVIAFMKLQLEHSPINVPAPEPFLDEKAKTLSNPDVWTDIKIALSRVSPEDGRIIARMLVLKYNNVVQCIDEVANQIREASHEVVDFVTDNPKYQRTPDELGDITEALSKLLGIDEDD